jgi:hypothetical protein
MCARPIAKHAKQKRVKIDILQSKGEDSVSCPNNNTANYNPFSACPECNNPAVGVLPISKEF